MKSLSSAVVCIALTGCASIFSGTTQDVSVRTTPGANYTVTNTYGKQVASGVVGEDSLATVNLMRGASYFSPHAYTLKLNKEGYRPALVNIDPGMNGWYFANLAIGGILGMLVIDPLTGAMYRLVPRSDEAMLEKNSNYINEVGRRGIVIKEARNFPVSKYEYDARQFSKAHGCVPIATPKVEGIGTATEVLTFQCENGSSLGTTCRSGAPCE